MFAGQHILIGVGGGIAAYRIAELVRLLIQEGAQVRCVMTKAAQQFVTPLTFEALSGEKIYDDLFDLIGEQQMGHIQLARWADMLLLAPATADRIAKMAHGIADDLLGAIIQARRGSILIAPAMNTAMWESTTTQRNIHHLREQGMLFSGPEAGMLACGENGMGRLSQPDTLMQALAYSLCSDTFTGQHWLINAGSTREYWDQVRYLGNAASGKLGFALAAAAAARGASVDLVAGPETPETPQNVTCHHVISAKEMFDCCVALAAEKDVFIATAAVGDFRFCQPFEGKYKRGNTQNLTLELNANPDIVAHICKLNKRPTKIIAFAAECEQHISLAQEKLRRKGADAIIANDISGMGIEDAKLWWIQGEHLVELERMSKKHLAVKLVELIENMEPT